MTMADLKRAVVSQRATYWKDPDSIKGAQIGNLSLCQGWVPGDCSCVVVNAKNSMGGYTGLVNYTVVHSGQQIRDIRRSFDTEMCSDMQDFAELNGK